MDAKRQLAGRSWIVGLGGVDRTGGIGAIADIDRPDGMNTRREGAVDIGGYPAGNGHKGLRDAVHGKDDIAGCACRNDAVVFNRRRENDLLVLDGRVDRRVQSGSRDNPGRGCIERLIPDLCDLLVTDRVGVQSEGV